MFLLYYLHLVSNIVVGFKPPDPRLLHFGSFSKIHGEVSCYLFVTCTLIILYLWWSFFAKIVNSLVFYYFQRKATSTRIDKVTNTPLPLNTSLALLQTQFIFNSNFSNSSSCFLLIMNGPASLLWFNFTSLFYLFFRVKYHSVPFATNSSKRVCLGKTTILRYVSLVFQHMAELSSAWIKVIIFSIFTPDRFGYGPPSFRKTSYVLPKALIIHLSYFK